MARYRNGKSKMDWVNRFAVFGELDVNAQGRSPKETEAAAAAMRATQSPMVPAMVLLHSDGQMLEYQPVDHVPSQAVVQVEGEPKPKLLILESARKPAGAARLGTAQK